jgi:hypothetical protein
MEIIEMFHDLLSLFRECVPFSTTSITASNASFVHMPLLVFGGTRFSYGVGFLFCGSGARGIFFLLTIGFIACKSNMLFCLLWRIIKLMIAYLFLVPTSNNLV